MSGKNRVRAAVIQFPGVNCEYESCRVLDDAGARAEIIRWNVDPVLLSNYDLFLLPGGFSYQDRVRAGAVAAKDEILEALAGEADLGKPVLGICNGAQVLIEAGIVPEPSHGSLDMALAPNKMPVRTGYYTDWSYLKASGGGNSWASNATADLLPIPFAHGEGRFTSRRPGLFQELEAAGQIVLRYARPDGSPPDGWPANPNGSTLDAAGICNPLGNVVAMMPHPERAAWLGQVPEMLAGPWGEKRRQANGDWEKLRGDGPGMALFRAMVQSASENREKRHAT
jgi:phosphoribosylformylglycinamidine synthase subunit PurQ / glutaminase